MSEDMSKNIIVSNIGWKLLERSSSLFVSFSVNIVLSRLLSPEDFGLLAMVNVFVTILQIFVTSGLGNALVQKIDADELDFSTMFWLNILISLILYLLVFITAPFISRFYGYSELTKMLRVLGLQLLIVSVNSIQCAYISRKMLFRFYFSSTLVGKIGSGILGIVLACLGFGAWALIIQSVSLVAFETIILWLRINWRPQKVFSAQRARELYAFAWKIMMTSFIDSVRDKVRDMFIGRSYSSESLAFYDKGMLFPNTIITNCSTSLATVMFPVISKSQENRNEVLNLCRNWISKFSYFAFPILAGLIASADSFIVVLIGNKWLPTIVFLRMACIYYGATVIERPIRETIKAVGRSEVCLKMQIIKMILALTICFLTINISIEVVSYGLALCAILNVGVSAYYAKKCLGYKLSYIITDISFPILSSVVMAFFVSIISLFELNHVFTLIIKVIIGITVYILISVITKNQTLKSIFNYIVHFVKKR